jgi:hypothetical protein
MANQGYVTFAMNFGEDSDEIRYAYTLACSLKLHDSEREVCLITDKFDNIPSKYEDVFDYIIELPYGDKDYHSPYKEANLWQMYYCTPFEENIYIDRHSVITSDISSVWDTFSIHDIVFPEKVNNFREETINDVSSFTVHDKNKLPNYYTDVFYFKKSAEAAEFFKMADPAFQNWRDTFYEFVKESRPEYFDINLMWNIIAYMIGHTQHFEYKIYSKVILDSMELIDEDIPNVWTDYINVWSHNSKILKVNNHIINGIFNYQEPEFLTKEIFNDYKERYKETTITLAEL